MFERFSLSTETLARLRARGITQPTPIQEKTLEAGLAGRDVLGQARTGTGKTLAFALPIAERLEASRKAGRRPRALILTPTRELALQVAGEISWIAPHHKVVAVYGGTGYGSQAADLRAGCDVVVATPGRAKDYLERGTLGLAEVEIVVLDEADEMLSMGFEEDVEAILAQTPSARQTLLFSATLPRWAERLVKRHLKNPVWANVAKDERVTYKEEVYTAHVGREEALARVLFAKSPERSIVFVRTKAEADRLAARLVESGLAASAVHGDLSQRERERTLGAFRQGVLRILVATDVAARGLDIPEVDLVVHHQLPDKAESYQHRSGRTARAGREGTVAILVGPQEAWQVKRLERTLGRRFERCTLPTPEAVRTARMRALVERARAQSEADKAEYLAFAESWIKAGDTETLAGLLAMLLKTPKAKAKTRPANRRRVVRR